MDFDTEMGLILVIFYFIIPMVVGIYFLSKVEKK